VDGAACASGSGGALTSRPSGKTYPSGREICYSTAVTSIDARLCHTSEYRTAPLVSGVPADAQDTPLPERRLPRPLAGVLPAFFGVHLIRSAPVRQLRPLRAAPEAGLNEHPVAAGPQPGPLSHLGIQSRPWNSSSREGAPDPAGLATFDEGDTTCCSPARTKVWAHDPDGTPGRSTSYRRTGRRPEQATRAVPPGRRREPLVRPRSLRSTSRLRAGPVLLRRGGE